MMIILKNHYEKEVNLTSTYSDRRCELGIFQAALLLQDAMTELFHQYRCDAIRLAQTHQVVWAVARTKICYDKEMLWMDHIRLKVFPVKVSPISIHLNVLLETLDGEPLLRARQEMCAIDVRDHSLRRVDSTPFPMDMDLLRPVVTAPCRRMKLKLGEECLVYSYQVRTMDTDLNHHMNNTNYIRLILDAQPSSFWDRYRVQEFDVHYVNESVEGEEIQVYCQTEAQEMAVQIKRGETTLVKAFLQLAQREKSE